jgi:branched-chain amino acid transport system substrate-binding protein
VTDDLSPSLPRRMIAGAVATVAMVAGCATACGHSSTSTDAAACSTQGITPKTISAGLLYPGSGPASKQFLGFRAGVDARFGMANAAGGVGGRTLRYDWADDASSPTGNLVAAQDLVTTDHDFAVLEASATGTGSAAWLHAQDVPVLGAAADGSWSSYPNMITWANYLAPDSPETVVGRFVKQHGGTKAVIISNTFIEASATYSADLTRSLSGAGVDVAASLSIANAADVVHAVAVIRQLGANVIAGAFTSQFAAALIGGAQGNPVPLKVAISPTLYDESLLTDGGQALAGAYAFVSMAPFELNLPAHRQYLAAMSAYAPQAQVPEGLLSLTGWIAADLFITGMKAAGPCPTRASFTAALRGLHSYSADGLVRPPADLSNYRKSGTCYTFVRVDPTGARYDVQPQPAC